MGRLPTGNTQHSQHWPRGQQRLLAPSFRFGFAAILVPALACAAPCPVLPVDSPWRWPLPVSRRHAVLAQCPAVASSVRRWAGRSCAAQAARGQLRPGSGSSPAPPPGPSPAPSPHTLTHAPPRGASGIGHRDRALARCRRRLQRSSKARVRISSSIGPIELEERSPAGKSNSESREFINLNLGHGREGPRFGLPVSRC